MTRLLEHNEHFRCRSQTDLRLTVILCPARRSSISLQLATATTQIWTIKPVGTGESPVLKQTFTPQETTNKLL